MKISRVFRNALTVRFVAVIALPVMLLLVTTSVIGFLYARHEAEEIYDAQMVHVAKLTLSLVVAEEEGSGFHPTSSQQRLSNAFRQLGHAYEKKIALRIWQSDTLLFSSSGAIDFSPIRSGNGFLDVSLQGKDWRFFTLADPVSGLSVEVAERYAIRAEMTRHILSAILYPFLLSVPLILWVAWRGLHQSLRPLTSISESVKRRSSDDLTPLAVLDPPIEVAPLIHSINALLGRLARSIEKERRFTDYAAHELRTPIAIIKTYAQTALRAKNEEERCSILTAQMEAVNRAAGLIDQLLTLARVEYRDISEDVFSLSSLIEDVCAQYHPLLTDQKIVVQNHLPSSHRMRANQELLSLVLRNLLDNALKYSPEASEIQVIAELSDDSSLVRMVVRDSGPGIAEKDFVHVTERFYRAAHHTKHPGAGLGLSIVKRACERMGAALRLFNRTDCQGLEVVVEFSVS